MIGNLKYELRKAINDKLQQILVKQGGMIFFKDNIMLSDGRMLVALTCNSANCVLTTKKIGFHTETFHSVSLKIAEEIANIIEKGNCTISGYGWIARGSEDSGDDNYFETSKIPYPSKPIALQAMMENALDFIKDVTNDKFGDVFEGYDDVKLHIKSDCIIADWLVYKLVYVEALEAE